MGALRFCVIFCDYDAPGAGPCGEESPPEWCMKAARATAKREGFVRRKGLDLCPRHAAAPL